jgi:hypothetical protein
MVESSVRFRNLAEEMRVLAAYAQNDRTREQLLIAASNYDRVAGSWELIERSRARIGGQRPVGVS